MSPSRVLSRSLLIAALLAVLISWAPTASAADLETVEFCGQTFT